jgi:hypothetical protein
MIFSTDLIPPSYDIAFELNGCKLCLLFSRLFIRIKYLFHFSFLFKIIINILFAAEWRNGHFNLSQTIIIVTLFRMTPAVITITTTGSKTTKIVMTMIIICNMFNTII